MITPPRYEARLLPLELQLGANRTHGLWDSFSQAFVAFEKPGSFASVSAAARRYNIGYECAVA